MFQAGDLGFWALSRFEDVLAAAHDPQRFTSGGSGALTGHSRIPFPNLAMLDDPRHGQLRALVSRAFSIRPIAAFSPACGRWHDRSSPRSRPPTTAAST